MLEQQTCGTAFAEAAPVMTVEGEDFMKIYCEPYFWILYYITSTNSTSANKHKNNCSCL